MSVRTLLLRMNQRSLTPYKDSGGWISSFRRSRGEVLSIGDKVSQEVSAPFRVLPIPSKGNEGSPWPLLALLTVSGAGVLGFGIWLLAVSLPDYSIPTVVILVGGLLLCFAFKVFRTINADEEHWLGFDHERFYSRMGKSFAGWQWADVGPFRVEETVKSGFEIKYKKPGLDDEVNFKQTTTVTLSAEVRERPPIDIRFEIFVPKEGRERDRAENFCRFLNDIRERANNGDLVRGAPQFLAPVELNIVPMRDGAPLGASGRSLTTSKPAVVRQ